MERTKCNELHPAEDTGAGINLSRRVATGRGGVKECAEHNQEASHSA